ncbi:MAG: DUF350 domain-containing protein, partial [Thermoanaerobaculia bacterium]
LAYLVNTKLTKKNEIRLLRKDHQATAIELGTTIVCQCILARHSVFALMAVLRTFLVTDLSMAERFWVFARSAFLLAIIISFSILSVWFAGWIFKHLTKAINEDLEIGKNNIAVAIFFALVLLGMTLILNDGMQDFSQSLVPYGRTGVLRISP